MRLELLGAVIVASGAILSVRGASVGALGAGLAGLAITNALGVTGLLNWAVRCLAETEAMMNSVERVYGLVETVEAEAPAVLVAEAGRDEGELEALQRQLDSSSSSSSSSIVARPVRALGDDALLTKSGWPWKGGVYFRQAVMRYREDTEPILQVGACVRALRLSCLSVFLSVLFCSVLFCFVCFVCFVCSGLSVCSVRMRVLRVGGW